jgi:hypothetical protein
VSIFPSIFHFCQNYTTFKTVTRRSVTGEIQGSWPFIWFSILLHFVYQSAVPVDDDFIDKDIVAADTVTEERSLVIRKSGQRQNSRTNTIDKDDTKWCGRIVKNFKKFRKVCSFNNIISLPK